MVRQLPPETKRESHSPRWTSRGPSRVSCALTPCRSSGSTRSWARMFPIRRSFGRKRCLLDSIADIRFTIVQRLALNQSFPNHRRDSGGFSEGPAMGIHTL